MYVCYAYIYHIHHNYWLETYTDFSTEGIKNMEYLNIPKYKSTNFGITEYVFSRINLKKNEN